MEEWDPEHWKEDTWEDSSEDGDVKPLNSTESSLQVEKMFPSCTENVYSTFPEETVMASLKVVALKSTDCFPHGLLPPPFFASRSLSIL